jgi:hypothetical protein|tara:strand:+ start:31 stop:1008 length:978 start_codon:yes stop_codon:yes gene_type:complete
MAGCIGTYYYDGTDFAGSTSIYTDSTLSTVAADGWYSLNGISRRMLNGILEQAQACLGCAAPCTATPSATNAGGGSYKAVIDLGVSTGAVILTFTVNNIPDKMSWTYDGLTASEYSSPDFGYLQGLIGSIVAAGSSTYCNSNTGGQIDNATGSNGGIYPNTSVFNYDAATNSFVATGATVTLGPYTNQAAGGVSFTSTKPGVVVMVVPKPNASPNLLEIDVEAPCLGTAWSMTSSCPAVLTQTLTTVVKTTQSDACNAPTRATPMFNAPVNGTAGVIGLYDWVFTDANGVTAAAAGFYSSGAQGTGAPVFEVSSDGVVTSITTCP